MTDSSMSPYLGDMLNLYHAVQATMEKQQDVYVELANLQLFLWSNQEEGRTFSEITWEELKSKHADYSAADLNSSSKNGIISLTGFSTFVKDQETLDRDTEKLEEYAAALGADCAFFINNMPTYAEGIGNLFSPITLSLKDYQILLVKPDIFVSTREAFSLIKPHKPEYSLKETIALPVSEWKERLVNDFETSVFPQYLAIGEIKDKLYQKGAIYAAMSGSGSSVFGLFTPGTPLPEADFGKESFVFKGKMI